LINLLKKSSIIYEWDKTFNEAFETLKGILVKTSMLKLPDFDKDFEIHFNASSFAIKGVLVQDGRLVTFESNKLSEIKRRWPTHEKEMWAMIHYLKTYKGHYINSKDMVVRIDNVTLKYFDSTKVVIEISEMARHIGLIQCGHSTQAHERKHGA